MLKKKKRKEKQKQNSVDGKEEKQRTNSASSFTIWQPLGQPFQYNTGCFSTADS